MAIDPPYRLDPFRNIVGVQWETATAITGSGYPPDTVIASAYFGILYLYLGFVYYNEPVLNDPGTYSRFYSPDDPALSIRGYITGTPNSIGTGGQQQLSEIPGDFTGDVSEASVTWNVFGRNGHNLIFGPWISSYGDWVLHSSAGTYSCTSVTVGSIEWMGSLPFEYRREAVITFSLG